MSQTARKLTYFGRVKKMTDEKKIDLTEKEAALAYSRMYNRLDATEFIELLDPDVTYESAWVNSQLRGKENVADYLVKKMKAIRACLDEEPHMKPVAELVIGHPSGVPEEKRTGFAFHDPVSPDPTSFEVQYFDERPCVLLTQAKDECTVVFEVDGPYIKEYNMVARRWFEYKHLGIFPE